MTGSPPLARGDIVLTNFPFSNLAEMKIRPCYVLGIAGDGDVILAFITSRIIYPYPATICLLSDQAKGFGQTGLRVSSAIRLDKIATLSRDLLLRRLGTVDQETQDEIRRLLRLVFDI